MTYTLTKKKNATHILTLLFGFGGYMHQQQKCVIKVLVVLHMCETPRMAIMRDDRRDVTGTESVKLIKLKL